MSLYDSNPELFERLKKDCRLVVFDEAHKAAADKTKRIIENLMLMPQGYENRALIGLSATPGRTTEASYDNNGIINNPISYEYNISEKTLTKKDLEQ